MTNAAVASRTRVLVVADDVEALATCESTLRSAGHDVIVVNTFEQACRWVHDEKPDLVVLGGPLGGSVIDLLRRSRGKALIENVPVVIVGGCSSSHEVQQRSPESTKGSVIEHCSLDSLGSCAARILRRGEPRRTTRMLGSAAHGASDPSPRPPLALVYPNAPAQALSLVPEHEGELHARCQLCLRGSPPLGSRAGEAEERVVALGWEARADGWDCPVCIERSKTMRPKRPVLRRRSATEPLAPLPASERARRGR